MSIRSTSPDRLGVDPKKVAKIATEITVIARLLSTYVIPFVTPPAGANAWVSGPARS
jgi:hypothetical protein